MATASIPNLNDLIRVLNVATDHGNIHWDTTADEESFRANLGLGMVRVSRISHPHEYSLVVIDQDGLEVAEFQPVEDDQTDAMRSLYNKARGRALGAEGKLKILYDHLKVLAGET